nr:hypothetical protein [Tanacetum cinerariifolium]
MLMEESDDLNIPDAAPIEPVLEPSALPKFDMHLYQSSLTKSHARYLVKLYGIPEELHPLIAPVVITMAEFLRLPNFKGCKVAAGSLLPPGTARVTHLAPPTRRLEDIPSKTADMVVAEILCQKVLDDKEKKKRKTEGKIAEPLEALANEEHVSPPLSFGSMNTLKDQTDEHAAPPRIIFASNPVVDKGVQDNVDASHAVEGHGDNKGGLSELQTHPSPAQTSGRRLDILKNLLLKMLCRMRKPAIPLDVLEIFPSPLNGASLIQAVWTTHSAQQQANTLLYFEALKEHHADHVYVHESCKDVKVHYKECKKELTVVQLANDEKVSTLDQLSKNYDEALTQEKGLQDRLEELEEEKKEADQLNSSHANWIKQLEEALKQSEADAQQLRVEKKRFAVEAAKDEMVRQRIVIKFFPTFVRWLHQSAKYKRSLGEVLMHAQVLKNGPFCF